MFTGLIEAVCTARLVRPNAGGLSLSIDLGPLADGTGISDSIAVNGVCLTVARLDQTIAAFDVSAETLAKSTIGKLKPSSQVNTERAMKATGRFGGHIVQGHIDGTATIKSIDKLGRFADITFAADTDIFDRMVVKGSVAVDGVSLTIAEMDQNSFSVAVIPQTLEKTTLGRAKVGDMVNVETDIIAKMIKKQLDKILPQNQNLTVEKLKQSGF